MTPDQTRGSGYELHPSGSVSAYSTLLLPYRVFSKDLRVSHTAIVENKRLGHALALVKAQQDLRDTTTVMTNSEKTGYRKRTRMVSAPLPVLSNARNS